jgi:hypothetical protein
MYLNYSLSYLQKRTTKKYDKVRLMLKALMKWQRDTPHVFHCLSHTLVLEYWFMYQTSSIMRCRALTAPKHAHYRTVSNAYWIAVAMDQPLWRVVVCGYDRMATTIEWVIQVLSFLKRMAVLEVRNIAITWHSTWFLRKLQALTVDCWN